jgi:peptidyl-prolyl cis-trans isomerase SurA
MSVNKTLVPTALLALTRAAENVTAAVQSRLARPILLGALCLTLLVAPTGSSFAQGQRQLLDRVVAMVDGDVVLQSELERRLEEARENAQRQGAPVPPADQFRQQILDMLIIESLQLQYAERVSIRYDDDTINRVLTNMAASSGMSFNDYVSALQAEGVYLTTREEVRRQLTIQELQRGAVNRRITITEQEIDNFLNSETGREVLAPDYLVEDLRIPTPATDSPQIRASKLRYAGDLATRIREGTNIAAIRSGLAGSSEFPVDGTSFGWRKAEQLPRLFSDIVTGMSVGEVEGPIEAGNGFHIIQLMDKQGGTEQIVNQTNLRHIMLTPNEIRNEEQTIELINELRQRILDGEDFATIARQNSDDASSVVGGGDLDWINEGGMPPEMEEVVGSLEVGEISEPFRTATGWHIAEVLGRREEDLSQQYTRAQAENALRNRKFDLELQNWLIELREEAFVEIVE